MNNAPVTPTRLSDRQISNAEQRELILARAKAVIQAESAAILDAGNRLGDDFVRAVEAIYGCKGRVCLTGIGKAGLIGNKIQATLASTGTPAYSVHPVEALHGDIGMVQGCDVILALSKSGGSELVELLPMLSRLGCTILLLTANPESPAAKHADCVLDIGNTPEACPLGLAPSSSTAAMLALGDALALAVMELKQIEPEQYASFHPGGALGRFLMKAHEIVRTGDNCPTIQATDTLHRCYEVILGAPRRAGAAVVVDQTGKLVGIVTHGDFFRLFEQQKPSTDVIVKDVMTKNPKRIHQDALVRNALQLMSQHAIDELPVVNDNDQPIGLIDIQDLIDKGF